jgi:hypothetical protein
MIEHFVIGPMMEKIIEGVGIMATTEALTSAFKGLSKTIRKNLRRMNRATLNKEVASLVQLATLTGVFSAFQQQS